MKCCDIPLNELNRKVVFKELVNTPDGQGGFESSFTSFKTMWCRIKPMKGSEKVARDRLNTTQLYTIHCRWFDGLVETMQALYKNEEFQIRSIVNIEEKNEWYEVIAERKAKAQ